MIIRYHLDLPGPAQAPAKRTLELILDGIGAAGVEVGGAENADLLYSDTVPAVFGGVWIRFDPAISASEEAVDHALTAIPGRRIDTDLLGVLDQIVSGRLERSLPTNEFGVPTMLVHTPGSQLLTRPAASELIDALGGVLAAVVPNGPVPIARWPTGHAAALLLTHDVDRPYLRPRTRFYRDRLTRDLRQARPRAAIRGLLGWARARTAFGPSRPTHLDPNFGFDYWKTVERQLGGTGCFYVAVRSAAERRAHFADVAYDAADPEIVQAMRRAVDQGWEVGLHASIHCAAEPERFVEEKTRLEDLLSGTQVVGVRHHYWALSPVTDWRPSIGETWSAQAQAGLRYDSSLGTNDAPGFRRGLAWPWRCLGPSPFLQIPPTLMDGAIFYRDPDPESARRAISGHFERVFAIGGAAVLDWHLEQANPNRLSGAGPVLLQALQSIRSRSDIWVTTPARVAEWWTKRAQMRAALLTTRERITLRETERPSRSSARRVSPALPGARKSES